jgi:hypothetical protein
MSIDNELRDALRSRADDITGDPNALTAIGVRVVRVRRRRAALASVAAVVVLVSGGLLATNLLSSDSPGGFVAPGGETPAPSSTRATESMRVGGDDLTLPWQQSSQYFDRRGFYVAYPEDFERAEWEGHIEIRVPGLPPLASGQPTWAVGIDISGGTAPVDACNGTPGEVTIRGEQVETCETRGTEFVRRYAFYWPDAPCDHPELACASRDAGLRVVARIIASNKEFWDQHLDHGEKIVGTIKRAQSDPHGFRADEDARAVADDFLQARVNGSGVERYATANAMTYPEIYGHGSGNTDYVRYEITGIEGADANSFVIAVDMVSEDGTISHEEIGVGPDEGVLRVRYIVLVSRETA